MLVMIHACRFSCIFDDFSVFSLVILVYFSGFVFVCENTSMNYLTVKFNYVFFV
jgi:hypothetical protein